LCYEFRQLQICDTEDDRPEVVALQEQVKQSATKMIMMIDKCQIDAKEQQVGNVLYAFGEVIGR